MTIFLLVLFLWIFSICLHEFAHAYVALRGGDDSVVEKGYLTLNPVRYLDPVNSLLLPIVFLIFGGIGLPGAAVYIEMHRIRSAMWQSAVSAAGPAMNLLILIVVALLIQVLGLKQLALGQALAFFAFLQATAVILNMLPIPGFDGFGVIAPHLPLEVRISAMRAAPMITLGFIVLLIALPGFGRFISIAALTLIHWVGIDMNDFFQGSKAFFFWRN